MDNGFIQAMRFRYACKKFDTTRSIPPEVFESILESGRLSPSSFGMEPTRLLVVRDKEKKERLKALCWNQDQITQASELVVYLSKIADMRSDTNYAMWILCARVSMQIALRRIKMSDIKGSCRLMAMWIAKAFFNGVRAKRILWQAR